MATFTTRLAATKPASSENVSITVLDNNFDLFDAAVGATVGVSAARPAAFSGRVWYDTDLSSLRVNTAVSASTAAVWSDASGLYDTRVSNLERPPINSQAGTAYTASASDNGKIIEMTAASANTITFPTMTVNSVVGILQYGTGATNIAGTGVTIRSRGSLTRLAGQYAFATLAYRSPSEAVLFGDLG